MSNALPLSMSNMNVPAAPASRPRATVHLGVVARPATMGTPTSRPVMPVAFQQRLTPLPPPPLTMPERMVIARERIRTAALSGVRVRSYEVALDLDLSEFHFARQFRAAFGRSPHVYYDEVRAERARIFLSEGIAESEVARRVGFRRPAELRSLLSKRAEPIAV